jgi:hypothetical protein
MPKTTKPDERSPSGKPPKAQPKSTKGGDLSEADLDRVAGGTKHPAKVTVPDLKIAVS